MDAKQLTEGLTIHERKDGSVVTVKSADGKATVAEICVGIKKTRVNFRATPKGVIVKQLGGKSKSWPGGGLVVDEKNAKVVRAALVGVAQSKAA